MSSKGVSSNDSEINTPEIESSRLNDLPTYGESQRNNQRSLVEQNYAAPNGPYRPGVPHHFGSSAIHYGLGVGSHQPRTPDSPPFALSSQTQPTSCLRPCPQVAKGPKSCASPWPSQNHLTGTFTGTSYSRSVAPYQGVPSFGGYQINQVPTEEHFSYNARNSRSMSPPMHSCSQRLTPPCSNLAQRCNFCTTVWAQPTFSYHMPPVTRAEWTPPEFQVPGMDVVSVTVTTTEVVYHYGCIPPN